MSRRIHQRVSVEIDMGEIDTDDLVDELASRKTARNTDTGTPLLSSEETHPLHEIYYAFKFGMSERATELARAYVCDELGVVL